MNFEIDQTIRVRVSGAVAVSAVFCQVLHGRVTRLTDKAVQITCTDSRTPKIEGRSIWFPKKAIVQDKAGELKLAPWFTAGTDGYVAWFLDNVEVSGVSA